MRDYSTCLEADRLAIFLFHGVIRHPRNGIRNYTRKHLTLDEFVSVIRLLCAKGVPVSMRDSVAASMTGEALPQRAFAITFDDGFENNYSVAAPILHELRAPATFYITTGFVESNASSWTDMIEFAVEKVGSFRLTLPVPGLQGSYATRQEKLDLLDRIRQLVKLDPRLDPYGFAYEVWRQLGVTAMEPDAELDQKMSWAQVRELSGDRLFTIGGHGHTHRILEYLEPSELEREIALSMESLRANLDVAIEHYSYPEGLSSCYSGRVIELLRRHGIVCAVTAEEGTNRIGEDLFRLKRIAVIP